jgi:hypothetical protein
MACNEIFKRISSNKDQSIAYEVQFSMLEIYNEKVQDLLEQGSTESLKVREN